MKCPKCDGKGTVLKIIYEDWQKDEIVRSAVKCPKCNGTGEVEVTNEEWRKTCSTEDFAEALTKVVLNIVAWNNDPKPSEVYITIKNWLKREHE